VLLKRMTVCQTNCSCL